MFSQFTSTLDILEDFLTLRKFSYVRMDGSTKGEDRQSLLAQFNADDSPIFVFLISTRAGALGLNLQTADTVIMFDSDWNPQMDLQVRGWVRVQVAMSWCRVGLCACCSLQICRL